MASLRLNNPPEEMYGSFHVFCLGESCKLKLYFMAGRAELCSDHLLSTSSGIHQPTQTTGPDRAQTCMEEHTDRQTPLQTNNTVVCTVRFLMILSLSVSVCLSLCLCLSLSLSVFLSNEWITKHYRLKEGKKEREGELH